jgi:hypothetical protein
VLWKRHVHKSKLPGFRSLMGYCICSCRIYALLPRMNTHLQFELTQIYSTWKLNYWYIVECLLCNLFSDYQDRIGIFECIYR